MRWIVIGIFALSTGIQAYGVGDANAEEVTRNEPYPVELQVGETFKVCLSGEIVCPVRGPICDNLEFIQIVDTPDGLGFKGIAAGTTLCSVSGGGRLPRRVFLISVRVN